jgi:catechol 2,3-dioxygenase-like lactoylglutathione lyase family enzyme
MRTPVQLFVAWLRVTAHSDVFPPRHRSITRLSENIRMPTLNLEHFACNVTEPAAMAAWYVEHLGMRVVRLSPVPSQIHFLADAAGRAVIEIYRNTEDPLPDYTAMNPIRFHIAFATADPDASRAALVAVGATFVEERMAPDGSRLLMLRDPWGMPLQLCKRPTPLLIEA